MTSISRDWQPVTVGDVCEFKYGKSLPEASRTGGAVPVFGSNGEVGKHDEALTSGPTIIIGRKGSFGEVLYSPVACWPIDTAYYVDQTATNADLRWLTYRLSALGLNRLNRAAAVPGLNREDAYRQILLLPPLAEQQRIAAILDKADALRVKRRAALAKLEDLSKSLFLEIFGDPATNPKGWPIQTIGDLLESASYGTSEKAEATGQFAVLRMNNITRTGDIDLSNLKYMNLDESDRERYLVRTGDVLFNRTNSPDLVGKTAIFREKRSMAYAGYLIRLRVNQQNNPEYLARFLNLDYSKRVLRNMCKSIIGMANINATEVQAIRIPRPPIELQNQFAVRVTGIERLKSELYVSLATFDSLFASLQQRAFAGEL